MFRKSELTHRKFTPNSLSTTLSFSTPAPPNQAHIVDELMRQQRRIIQQLTNTTNQLRERNQFLKQQLLQDNSEEIVQSLKNQISLLKQEEQLIEKKIQNCQIVDKNTTIEEYYIWQQRKIIEQNQHNVNEMTREIREQRDRLNQQLEAMREAKQSINQDIKEITRQRRNLFSEKSVSMEERPELTQEQIKRMHQQHMELSSTTQLLRENHEILMHQLVDNIDQRQKSLNYSFDNHKSTLINELIDIKKKTREDKKLSRVGQQKQVRVHDIISEYKDRFEEIRSKLPSQLKQQCADLLKPMDWQSLDWGHYLPKFEKHETDYHYEQYIQIQKEYNQNQQQIKHYQQQLNNIVEETAIYQQKKSQIQGKIHHMLNFSRSLSK